MKYYSPRILAVCLALAFAPLLVSCPSLLSNPTNGTITLSFPGAPRGMEIDTPEVVDPTLAIAAVRVDVSGPGMENLTSHPVVYASTGTTLTISIPAGPDRVVTVLALNATGTTLYSQAKTVNIVAGKDLRVSFNLGGVVYSVSFDANGGAGTMDPQSIAYGSTAALMPNTFTKAGHYFVGWATSDLPEANVNYADEDDYMMSSPEATLYAVWMANTNTVAFNANTIDFSGSMADQNIDTDTSATLQKNNFIRTDYNFAGWALTADGSKIFDDEETYPMGTSSVILYALWEPISYTIEYYLDGGSGTNPGTFTVESGTITLAPLTKNGYTFAGWFDNEGLTGDAITTIPAGSTGNKELWAKWTIISYNISYNLNGGTGTNPATFTVESGTITLAPPTKNGYTFAGWFENEGLTGDAITTIQAGSTGNKELWAKWTIISYNISYNLNGGTGTNPATFTVESDTITLTPPTRNEYTFGGWFDNVGLTGDAISTIPVGSTGNKELWAKWSLIVISGQFTGSVLDSGLKNNGGIPTTSGIASSAVSFTASSGSTAYGSYSVTTEGVWSYTLDTSNTTVNALAVGSSTTDTFTIDAGGMAQIITITIWGADDTSYPSGQYIQGDGSGGGGGGATGAHLGGTGGAGGGGDDTLAGTAGNDIIFGDGSGGGKGGRGVGLDDQTGTGAGPGGGGADSINGGAGDDIIFGDGFDGTMDQWNCGYGGFGGGGGGGSGAFLGGYLGEFGGLGGGSGSGYAGSKSPLISGFGYAGGSGNTPGGNSATSVSPTTTGLGGLSYGSTNNGHGGGGGFGGSSGGAGASTTGPGNPGQDGSTDEHRYDDTTGAIYTYVLGRLATILTDYPNYGAGNDTLDGGPGSDHLFGLGGNDTFVFELDDAYNGNDIDTIWDFNVSGTDTLSLKIGGTPIDATVRDGLIAAQITDGTDRKLVFSNGADKQVTIVIKNLGRDIVTGDFQ